MIVVTTPTGDIGCQVLANLLGSGERIRVIARDPSKLPVETLERVEAIEDGGVFYWPAPPDLGLPHCATRDVAALASGLLLDPSWSGSDSIPVLGPEDLSFGDMAGIMSEVLGNPSASGKSPWKTCEP